VRLTAVRPTLFSFERGDQVSVERAVVRELANVQRWPVLDCQAAHWKSETGALSPPGSGCLRNPRSQGLPKLSNTINKSVI